MNSAVVKILATSLCFCLMVEHITAAPAMYNDYDSLRDIYELLLRNEGLSSGTRYPHQMERKGGRSPSIRLRFGRRADPLWDTAVASAENGGPAASPDQASN